MENHQLGGRPPRVKFDPVAGKYYISLGDTPKYLRVAKVRGKLPSLKSVQSKVIKYLSRLSKPKRRLGQKPVPRAPRRDPYAFKPVDETDEPRDLIEAKRVLAESSRKLVSDVENDKLDSDQANKILAEIAKNTASIDQRLQKARLTVAQKLLVKTADDSVTDSTAKTIEALRDQVARLQVAVREAPRAARAEAARQGHETRRLNKEFSKAKRDEQLDREAQSKAAADAARAERKRIADEQEDEFVPSIFEAPSTLSSTERGVHTRFVRKINAAEREVDSARRSRDDSLREQRINAAEQRLADLMRQYTDRYRKDRQEDAPTASPIGRKGEGNARDASPSDNAAALTPSKFGRRLAPAASEASVADKALALHNGRGYSDLPELSNFQLEDMVDSFPSLRDRFLGVISRDQIDQLTFDKEALPFGFIYNTDPADKPGRHWRAVWITDDSVEFYDSLMEPLDDGIVADVLTKVQSMDLDNLLKIKLNNVKHQTDSSSSCGWHALKYLIDRSRDIPFIEASGFSLTKLGAQKKIEQKTRRFFDKYI